MLFIFLWLFIAGLGLLALGVAFLVMYAIMGRRFDAVAEGTVIKHLKYSTPDKLKNGVFTRPIVEYEVNGKKYRVDHRFKRYILHKTPRGGGEEDRYEIDDKYRLHYYREREFGGRSDIAGQLFPVGSTLKVHYMSGKPQKAYCGVPAIRYRMDGIVFSVIGIAVLILGIWATVIL